MHKLIRIESLKILRSPTVKAILAIHALLFLLVLLAGRLVSVNVQGVQVDKLFEFPIIWQTFSWVASWFNLLLGILAIVIVSADHQLRMYRKHIVDGLSRSEIVTAKTIVMLLLSLYTVFLVLVVGVFLGLTKPIGVDKGTIWSGLSHLPILFLQSFSYMALAMFMAFVFKNMAISIVCFVLYFFPVEPIISLFIPSPFDEYLIFNVFSELTPSPDILGTATDLISFNNPHLDAPEFSLRNIIVAIIYSVIFAVISRVIVSRRNF